MTSMTGVRSFEIVNKSPVPLVIISPDGLSIELYPGSTSQNYYSTGQYTVTEIGTGSLVIKVYFNGSEGSLDITPGSKPGYVDVVPNYDWEVWITQVSWFFYWHSLQSLWYKSRLGVRQLIVLCFYSLIAFLAGAKLISKLNALLSVFFFMSQLFVTSKVLVASAFHFVQIMDLRWYAFLLSVNKKLGFSISISAQNMQFKKSGSALTEPKPVWHLFPSFSQYS